MLTTEQKAIIRQICEEQESSLLRVAHYLSKKIQKELEEDGYLVSEGDIAEEISKDLIKWDEVKDNPERFLQILDDYNLGLVKHHLVQDYLGIPDSRKIWKQLNLWDEVNQNQN